jgi:hypothetical protein
MFRKVVLAAAAALSLAACTQHEQRVVGTGAVGAAAGAIIGGATTGTGQGAAIGAAIGGATGALLGHVTDRPGQCYARDQYGQTIIVRCPPGY